MALSEDKILVSYEINVIHGTVRILWRDRVLRDGMVVSFVDHPGAYELINGDLPDHIKQEFGISMASLTSAAAVSMNQANADLSAQLATAKAQISLMESAMTNN